MLKLKIAVLAMLVSTSTFAMECSMNDHTKYTIEPGGDSQSISINDDDYDIIYNNSHDSDLEHVEETWLSNGINTAMIIVRSSDDGVHSKTDLIMVTKKDGMTVGVCK